MPDPRDPRPVLSLGHSPDPDDVFMWWPITGMLDPADPSRVERPPVLDTGRFRYAGVPADISVLNRRAAEAADLEITALSIATYARVHRRYALTACGSSIGVGYGPRVVARQDSRLTPANFATQITAPGKRIAVPGRGTSAFLVLSMMVRAPFEVLEAPFDRIVEIVQRGEADAGLLIHQSQLTFEDAGLRLLVDLGQWWQEATGLPLPLGGNAIRRDLDDLHGPGACAEVARTLDASIRYALANRTESLAYAMRWAPEINRDQADRYIDMYVNEFTLDAGEQGRQAIQRLIDEGARRGLCPDAGRVEFIGRP
jgi:1,4-dihydroxy-6-naphthoate synthase